MERGLSPVRFFCKPHQNKGAAFRKALLDAGHTESVDHADVVLIDFEIPHGPPYSTLVEHAKQIGAELVAYPHGGSPVHCHHLIREPHKATAFVHGPGQKKLREIYGYPNPVHVVGYPGPRVPLKPRECRHVLFAPHHPLGSGWMPPDSRERNAEAFRILLEGDFRLTVRLIGTAAQNGLWTEGGVRYIWGNMDGEVDPADVVVAGGTYAANCLVRGIPVVQYHQEREWRVELPGKEPVWVPNWQEHHEFVRYPYDLSLPDACQKAAADPNVEWWIDRFLPPFQPEKFVSLVEDLACSRV